MYLPSRLQQQLWVLGVHEEETVESRLACRLSLVVSLFLRESEAWYWARRIPGETQWGMS